MLIKETDPDDQQVNVQKHHLLRNASLPGNLSSSHSYEKKISLWYKVYYKTCVKHICYITERSYLFTKIYCEISMHKVYNSLMIFRYQFCQFPREFSDAFVKGWLCGSETRFFCGFWLRGNHLGHFLKRICIHKS